MLKLSLLISILACTTCYALDVKKLANNKESESKQLSTNEILEVKEWVTSHPLQESQLKEKSLVVLQVSLNSLTDREAVCDLGLNDLLQKNAKEAKIILNNEDLPSFIGYLRSENLIDDLFYKILKDSNVISLKVSTSLNESASRPMNLYNSQNEGVDVKKLYEDFKTFPDEISNCSIGLYFKISASISAKNSNDRSRQLKRLNYLALDQNAIGLDTYNKLEILRQEEALEWSLYIKRYLDVLENSKDKMSMGIVSPVSTNAFSSKYASRKEKLTKRGRLYQNYDSTQVIMLAQLIEKAAKRRDAFSAILTFQYTEGSTESDNYVLSPMEKYRASVKMLRNEMGALMRSDNFKGVQIDYEDLISAAYETGLIRAEELDYVLEFEDMWNPKTPKWKAYVNFAFSLAGTAAFYLPPPYSFIGAIALVFTQAKVDEKPDPKAEDNWNIII